MGELDLELRKLSVFILGVLSTTDDIYAPSTMLRFNILSFCDSPMR